MKVVYTVYLVSQLGLRFTLNGDDHISMMRLHY